MKNLLTILILITFFSCSENTSESFNNDLKLLQNQYQKKLNSGFKMLQISKKYEKDTDSIMNTIYQKVIGYKKTDTIDLKLQQDIFLAYRKRKKDSLWYTVNTIYNQTGITPELELMVAYGTIGDLNYSRAVELNKLLENK